MKYGCCTNFLCGGPLDQLLRTIDGLQEAGFDYPELSVVDCMALSSENQKELAKALNDRKYPSEVVNSLFPREIKTTGPDVNINKVRDWYRKSLELSASLGAEYVVFGSPYAKSYPLGFERTKAYIQLLSLHRELNEAAASMGMTVLIEPCHRFECNLINTFADGVALAQDIGNIPCGVLFDYYHFTRNGESLDSLRKDGREYLKHIHFACPFHPGEPERTFPLDPNEWDYTPFADTIHEIGYTERMSIEAVCKDFNAQAKRSLALMKTLFS